MQAKDYLLHYKIMKTEIKITEDYIRKLEDAATSVGSISNNDEKVQSSIKGNRTEDLVVKICDLKIKYTAQIEAATRLMIEIKELIDTLSDNRYREILHLRYINLLTWEDIALTLNYNLSWIIKLHGRALQEVNRKLNKEQETKR